MEWRPIEHAPRDGTIVDLWFRDGGRATDVWWDDTDPEEGCWSCCMTDEPFTHYMVVEPPE